MQIYPKYCWKNKKYSIYFVWKKVNRQSNFIYKLYLLTIRSVLFFPFLRVFSFIENTAVLKTFLRPIYEAVEYTRSPTKIERKKTVFRKGSNTHANGLPRTYAPEVFGKTFRGYYPWKLSGYGTSIWYHMEKKTRLLQSNFIFIFYFYF